MRRFAPLLLLLPLTALAFPKVMHHQGRLNDSTGQALTGAHDLTFTLYDAPSSGSVVWTETQSTELDRGVFTVDLGADGSNALDEDWFSDHDELWLAIAVDGGAELNERVALRAAPWAIVAGSVSGGTVDASSISVNGNEVISSDGTIEWSAIANPPSDGLEALGCSDGQLAVLDGSSWTCSDRAHTHDASDLTGGILEVARIPVGTDGASVAAGDHSHSAADVGALPATTTAADIGALPVGTTAADIGAMPATGGTLTIGSAEDDACDSSAEGLMRWGAGQLQVCDGTEWLRIRGYGNADGESADTAAESCKDLLDNYPDTESGTYWIDGGGSTAWETSCDMTVDGGGWTLVAYAGDNSQGFPRMDIDVGAFNAGARSGKGSKGAPLLVKGAKSMALAYHSTTGYSGSLEGTNDTVSFVIPDPSIVDFKTSGNNGTCTAITAKRLKPDGSNHMCIGNNGSGTEGVSSENCNPKNGGATAGVWSKSLGGTYGGVFAYGVYGTEWSCNSWPNVSHHWWVDSKYYNWEPSATQAWSGAVNGATSIWLR